VSLAIELLVLRTLDPMHDELLVILREPEEETLKKIFTAVHGPTRFKGG
jgi:hypothetical protein